MQTDSARVRCSQAAQPQAAVLELRQKEELIKQQSRIQEEAETADAESIRRSVAEEEEATQRAIEEEEVLRKQVLQELEADGVRFRSGTEDVLEYAVYLGMDLREDVGLLWIADQALQADDPEGWDQCESPNGDLYYMHEVTKQVLWQHPLDYQYQQLYLEEKKKGQGKLDRRGSSNGAVVAPPKHGGSRGIDAPPAGGPVGSSDDALRRVLQQLLGTSHTELKRLLTEPATCRVPVRCFVIRHKSRMGGARFDFFMSISKTDDMYCFTAKKWSVSKGCYYSIALDQDDAKRAKASSSMPESYVGKVRSDRKAQEYTLYDDGASFDGKEKGGKSELRCELLHVNFSNSLRNRNPGAMTVVVPEVDSEGGMVPARPKDAAGQLNERLKRGDLGGLMELKNREPKWNPTSNMYQLDFHGRATLASCKNIQLHPKHGEQADVSFLMGKVEENKFNVDFKAPFSALQAFAFALIVFDNSSGSF